MTTFAETPKQYSDGQLNVYSLPENIMSEGFMPKQTGVRGQPLPANWLNWLFRELFRKANRDRLSNGAGIGVLGVSDIDCFVTVHAVVKADPTKYISAYGYKTGTGVVLLHTEAAATLGLGTITSTNIPITGAASTDVALRVTVTDAQ